MKVSDIESKIKSLKRRRSEILSASKTAERKTRTRALIVLGGIIAAEAKSNAQAVNFLLSRAAKLQPRDREILSLAFPQIFTPATATAAAATAAAENQEPTNA